MTGDYAAIRQWNRELGMRPDYIAAQVEKARADEAPADAIFNSGSGKWVTVRHLPPTHGFRVSWENREQDTTPDMPATERPKRMTLSQVLEMMLTRGAATGSSVSITRNPAGVPLIDVKVSVGDRGEAATVEEAERIAVEVYERLRDRFALPERHANAELDLTRNAKGETQIALGMKTTENGPYTVYELIETATDAYDKARMKYPMADGHTAKPGSVKA